MRCKAFLFVGENKAKTCLNDMEYVYYDAFTVIAGWPTSKMQKDSDDLKIRQRVTARTALCFTGGDVAEIYDADWSGTSKQLGALKKT